MSQELGAWLRAQRRARGWDVPQMARQLARAAGDSRDTLPSKECLLVYIRRWERGEVRVSERYQFLYCTAFGIELTDFGPDGRADQPRPLAVASPDLPDAPASDRAPDALAMHSRDPSITALPSRRYRDDEARRGRPVDPAEQTILAAAEESPGWAAFAGDWQQYERQLIMAAADESAGLARRAGQTNVHPLTLEQLDQDVDRLAGAYLTEPLVSLLYEMRQVRDVAFGLLEGRQYPDQARHLYVIAGQACGLFSSASSDLGYYSAAETHARTGWLCAELSGHSDLRAWILAIQSAVAFWDGRYRDAVQRARAGYRYASGLERVRLASLEARACGKLGDSDGVRAAIETADGARAQAGAESSTGIFGFPAANQVRCAGCAYLWLGETEAAVHALEHALQLYEADEASTGSYAHSAVTRVDLAISLLHLGRLDHAVEVVRPVLTLPPERRLAGVIRRFEVLRPLLLSGPFRDSPAARELDEQLEAFSAAGAARQLPNAAF